MENSKIINKIEENRNGIENILDKSSLDLEQKNVLKKVFKKLSKYSLDQLNGIENTVFENYKNTQIFTENLNKDCHFDIYTALVNKKQKKEFLSFNPIVDENLFGIFIDISYRDFVDICNGNKCSANITLTNGSSLSIQFNLNASNPFKSSEELLVKLIKQYGIRKSVIFSPYARRFVEIPLPENIKVEDKVNIAFSDNGRTYMIVLKNGETLTYNFQGSYYNKDKQNYETSNYESLRKIDIPKE